MVDLKEGDKLICIYPPKNISRSGIRPGDVLTFRRYNVCSNKQLFYTKEFGVGLGVCFHINSFSKHMYTAKGNKICNVNLV